MPSGLVTSTGTGTPAVVRIGGHGQHRIDRAGFQQSFGNACGDAGPLRAGTRWIERCPHHAPVRAEVHLVRARRVARAAMHPGFQAGVVGLDELAGLAAALRVVAARDAAVGAQVAVHRRADHRHPHWIGRTAALAHVGARSGCCGLGGA
jgi:hypothetical protein